MLSKKKLFLSIIGENSAQFCFGPLKFVVKTAQLHYKNISDVAEMLYNSTSDACLIVFVPNLAIQWPKADQKNFMQSHKCIVHLAQNLCLQALVST